jgi:hypothetical protein
MTFASGTIDELCRIRRAGHCVGDLPSYRLTTMDVDYMVTEGVRWQRLQADAQKKTAHASEQDRPDVVKGAVLTDHQCGTF